MRERRTEATHRRRGSRSACKDFRMDADERLAGRLAAQRLTRATACTSAEEAALAVIGVQAQDRRAAALALRSRVPGLTRSAISAAPLLRTWTVRGTGRPLRVANDHRHPQPPEAPQAPNSRRGGLKGPRTGPAALTTANATINTYVAACASRPFERQPPSGATARPQIETRSLSSGSSGRGYSTDV